MRLNPFLRSADVVLEFDELKIEVEVEYNGVGPVLSENPPSAEDLATISREPGWPYLDWQRAMHSARPRHLEPRQEWRRSFNRPQEAASVPAATRSVAFPTARCPVR